MDEVDKKAKDKNPAKDKKPVSGTTKPVETPYSTMFDKKPFAFQNNIFSEQDMKHLSDLQLKLNLDENSFIAVF